ncbi:hypothetical protein J4E81_001953 [Alternaria sp. BMP 2799]|nr:hypothetical protein J4E81_001953 [Alternaria sp. BMP 2799]
MSEADRYEKTTKMIAFLVKFAGLALYIHDLQSGTLTLLHERPNRKPKVYVLNEEDFEDGVDEIDDETVPMLEPGLETSAVGLSLRLFKNDGALRITFEGEHGGVVDWKFQGLEGSKMGSMTACAFTQTMPEASTGCKSVEVVPPEISISSIRTVSTDPIPQRLVQPLPLGLSIISTTETRPVKPTIKPKITIKLPKEKPELFSPTVNKEIGLKRKATEEVEQPKPHKLAKSSHDSSPWPSHLYMTCSRTHPISKCDVGTLHIDLAEGTVWFESCLSKF